MLRNIRSWITSPKELWDAEDGYGEFIIFTKLFFKGSTDLDDPLELIKVILRVKRQLISEKT